jgi:hypothetical protein
MQDKVQHMESVDAGHFVVKVQHFLCMSEASAAYRIKVLHFFYHTLLYVGGVTPLISNKISIENTTAESYIHS